MLYHESCEGHGEVVAQAFLAEAGGQLGGSLLVVVVGRYFGLEVARVEDAVEQFVALFAVLAHERGEVLHGGGFDLAEAVERIDAADGVEDIVAARHFGGIEIARALWYRWLLHIA